MAMTAHSCRRKKRARIITEVNAIENELTIQVEDEQSLKEKGLIKIIGEEIDKPYTEKPDFHLRIRAFG